MTVAASARVALVVLARGVTGLYLGDKAGQTRALLATSHDGSPCLSLRDKRGKSRAALFTRADGSPSLELWDKHETKRAALDLTPIVKGAKTAKSTLTLLDAHGTVIWQAPR
jgi:hypothetical protein